MPATHEDPQLGVLTRRRRRWRGELELEDGPVPLAVVGGRSGPDEAALALARRAGDDLVSCRPALEAALAEHREPYDDAGDGWAVEWASIEPLAGDLTLELGLRTAWDEEHTLGARVRGGRLVELNGSVLAP